MEEPRTIRSWFAQMESAAPSAEKKRLYDAYLDLPLGGFTENDVSQDAITALTEEWENKGIRREEAFAAVSLLRALFAYIARESGAEMPEVRLPSSFFRRAGIPEGSAYLLNELFTSSGENRHAAAFWLLLHTSLPLAVVLRVRARDIAVQGGNFILTYDRRARAHASLDPRYTETITLTPDASSIRFWEGLLAACQADKDNYLVSGSWEPERRRALEVSLNLFAGKCGLRGISLRDLSETEWSGDEAAEPVAVLSPDAPFLPGEGGEEQKELLRKLDEVLSRFPVPVQEHSRRTAQIAGFLLEHLRTEAWFIDEELDPSLLAAAVQYHDIGKSALLLDDYYPDVKGASEQTERYRRHVETGIQLFSELSGSGALALPAGALPGMIRDVIADHHERVDGKGFPAGKRGEGISLAGRICAIADSVDRRFFTPDGQEKDPGEVLDRIFSHAGTRFDARLASLLAENREQFLAFLGELRAVFRHQRNADAYGMRFTFRPFADKDGAPALAESHLFFNDPYYGLLDADKILPAVEDHPRYATFTRLAIKRLCRVIGFANENGKKLPPVSIRVSVKEIMKDTFFTNVFRIFVDCGITYRQVMFTLEEADVIDSGADVSELAEKCHVIGALMGISEFGGETTLLPSIARIHPDAVILRRKYAEFGSALDLDFVETVLQTARKLGFAVYCPGVSGQKQWETLQKVGIPFCGGSFFGKEMSEREFSGDDTAPEDTAPAEDVAPAEDTAPADEIAPDDVAATPEA